MLQFLQQNFLLLVMPAAICLLHGVKNYTMLIVKNYWLVLHSWRFLFSLGIFRSMFLGFVEMESGRKKLCL